METFKATYRWTQEEALRATRHHNEMNLRPSLRIVVKIGVVLLANMCVFVLVISRMSASILPVAVAMLGFCGYALFFHQPVTKWLLTRGFDRRPDANAPVEWEFSGNTIKIDVYGLASSEISWKLFVRVVETPDGLLIYQSGNVFNWLPFSAFVQPGDTDKVRELAKAHGLKYIRKPR